MATAQWKKLDARESFLYGLVDRLNQFGSNGFAVDKDMVLKAALVLSDFKDIAFKVDNFNKSNMLRIEATLGSSQRGASGRRLGCRVWLQPGYVDIEQRNVIPIGITPMKRGLPKKLPPGQDRTAADRRSSRNG